MQRKLLILVGFFFIIRTYSQNCSPIVPSLIVDLSSNPDTTWISPSIQRLGLCCNASNPDVCVEFKIYLNPGSQGIIFNIYSGAVPGGSMFYQINCGPPIAVGQPICLNGYGPHILTFCKPGNNTNQYSITSIPSPSISSNITLNEGCIGTIAATGLIPSTISMNSIYPGNFGAYNNFLSCPSGCSSSQVMANSNYPPFVDYQICGIIESNCSTIPYCDTVRVTFNPTLNVQIQPNPAVLCYGTNSLTLSATGSGGTPPYNFIWNTGETTQNINVGVGIYTVVLQDASNCPPVSTNISVTSYPSPIQVNAGNDQNVCISSSSVQLNGTVISAAGGIWTGGNGIFLPSNEVLNPIYFPTANEINIGFVNLVLTSTGNGSCPGVSDTIRINFLPFSGNVQFINQAASCYQFSDGSIQLNISGGNAPYSYLWSTSSTSNYINGLSAGNYTVTITDGIGCSLVQTTTITQPSALQAYATTSSTNCFGGSNGGAFVTIVGGTPGYLVQWSNGSIGNSVSNLTAGNYTFTVTDSKGCSFINNVIINQPDSLSVQVISQNPLCAQSNTGSIQLNISGGTPPYSYNWQPSNYNGATIQNLNAGYYTVTITDIKGCSKIKTVQLTDPPLLTTNITTSNPTCYGSTNGYATVNATGGTIPYVYVWSPYGGSLPTANNLGAGNYTVTVFDANGCSSINNFQLTAPPPLNSTINWTHNVSCYGGNDGSASISVSGGVPPYTYLWQPTGGNTSIGNSLAAGNYLVSITDGNNCVIQQSVNIIQPSLPLSIQLFPTNVSCYGGNDGQITSTVNGGTPPYSYSWSVPTITTPSLNNIAAGNYSLTVTDQNGCSAISNTSLSQPASINLSTSSIASLCGSSTGSASVIVSGGNPPYTYNWTPGNFTTSTINNVSSGVYNLSVTDALGCTNFVSVLINDIGSPTVTISSITNVSCFGGNNGSISVNASGGTPPYNYSWYPYGGSSSTANGLSAGTFNVSVIDANGCISTQIAQITQPTAIQLAGNKTDVSCNGSSNGQAYISAHGGTPPYNYFWQPGNFTLQTITNLAPGIYNVTVTDANNCTEQTFVQINQPQILQAQVTSVKNVSCYNGSDGSISIQTNGGTPPYNFLWSPTNYTSSQINNLSSGTHTVYITDSKGCATSLSVILTQPTPMSIFLTKNDANCYQSSDASATAFCSGGIPPYSYLWNPGGGNNQTFSGITSGTYFVTVTDSLGCNISSSIHINQPTPIIPVVLQKENVRCYGANDGMIFLATNGGTPPYNYHWNTNQTSPVISNLTVGTYSCTITDNHNCSATFSIDITSPSAPLSIITSSIATSCNESSDGIVSVTASGGTPPYSYLWIPTGETTPTVSHLSSGNYTVSVFDANQCVVSENIQVNSPTPLSGNIQIVRNVDCYGSSTGEISANVQGGTPPYSYIWNTIPQQNTATATNVYAGNYNVTVTDANACSIVLSGTISQPQALTGVLNTNNPTCYNGNNGSAWVNISGGTPPYYYTWSTIPSQTGFLASNLTHGIYYVTIVDALGCQWIGTCNLTNPPQIITTVTDTIVICQGESATLTASASGGYGNYFFFWNNNLWGQSISVTPLHSSLYKVIAFDSLGCEGIPDTCSVIVKEFYPSNVNLFANSPICPGNSSLIYVTSSANHYDTLYYTWSNDLGPGPGAFVIVPTEPTTYYVTVNNSCNIQIVDSISVLFKTPPQINFYSDAFQGCVPVTINFTDSSTTYYDHINRWFWNFGDGNTSTTQNPTHTFSTAGTYYVSLEVETNMGCSNNNIQNPLPVYIFENPTANFTTNKDIYYLPNDPVICTNLSNGAIAYQWDFGDGYQSFVENPIHNYNEFGQYQLMLIATNTYQCTDTAYKNISVSGDIIFPNAFTPDPTGSNGGVYNLNDYSNHVFFPITQGVSNFNLQIFNRWGELIFESNNINIGWDGYYKGQLCQQDVYVYQAKVTFIDGRKVEKKGDVLLIR